VVTHIRESRWFKSMYTLQGKPDTHDTYASCAGPRTPPYAFRGQSPYVATFHADPTKLNRFTAPEKKVLQTPPLSPVEWPMGPPQFLSQHNHWSSALKPNICWRANYIGLLGTYHQHVIGTFNTCSRGATHRSLTDTGGGYNLATSHSPTFPIDGPLLSIKGPHPVSV
jgi:hypothetical protein